MAVEQRQRLTRQRRAILEELRATHSHPSADEVFERGRRDLPRISLATVYRNLEVLSQSGMVLKLDLCGAQRRFDGTTDEHYHVRCVVCERVGDVFIDTPSNLEAASQQASGFEITGHWLEFSGICPGCSKKKSGNAAGAQQAQ